MSLKEERKGNQVADSVSTQKPANVNSQSDGSLKEILEMMKKISEKQESMDRKMIDLRTEISQKELIGKQIKDSVDEQNIGISEIAKQMVKIKKQLKSAKAGKSSDDSVLVMICMFPVYRIKTEIAT